MIGTAFLGYLNIAQNNYNIKPTNALRIAAHKRHFSTSLHKQHKHVINNFLCCEAATKNLQPVFIYNNVHEDSVAALVKL